MSNLTDNNVVGVLGSILEKTNEAKIPVYGSEIEQVKLGCVAGAGTLRPVKESTASVERFKNAASSMSTTESPYLGRLKDVEEKC